MEEYGHGYVYILINASMPGLIKVGMTTRSVEERAEELSRATGVPTAFVVAYKVEVNDCESGEKYVHSVLEDKGYRVNKNREFFTAPLYVAVDAINEYKSSEGTYTEREDKTPAEREYELAENYECGYGEFVKDQERAIYHYQKAIELGSSKACGDMARIEYDMALNVKKQIDEAKYIKCAIGYLLKGVELGGTSYYRDLARLYSKVGQLSEAKKYWVLYKKYDFDRWIKWNAGSYDKPSFASLYYYVLKKKQIPEVLISNLRKRPDVMGFCIQTAKNNLSHLGLKEYDVWTSRMGDASIEQIDFKVNHIIKTYVEYLQSLSQNNAVEKNYTTIEIELIQKIKEAKIQEEKAKEVKLQECKRAKEIKIQEDKKVAEYIKKQERKEVIKAIVIILLFVVAVIFAVNGLLPIAILLFFFTWLIGKIE